MNRDKFTRERQSAITKDLQSSTRFYILKTLCEKPKFASTPKCSQQIFVIFNQKRCDVIRTLHKDLSLKAHQHGVTAELQIQTITDVIL